MKHPKPPGFEFYDTRSGRHCVYVDQEFMSLKGWLFYEHPDGHWVSLRKATAEDRRKIDEARRLQEARPPAPAFKDIASLSEDDRIEHIGRMVMQSGLERVAVVVDDTPGTADRYVEKFSKRFPEIEVKFRGKGPTPGAYTVIVGCRAKGQP